MEPVIPIPDHRHYGGISLPLAAVNNIDMVARQDTSAAPPMNVQMPDSGGFPVTPAIGMTDYMGIPATSAMVVTELTGPDH